MRIVQNNMPPSNLRCMRVGAGATNADKKPDVSELTTAPVTTAVLNGQTLMKQRLFYIDDPRRDAPVETVVDTTTRSQSRYNFLTPPDRELIGKLYEYAQQEGADPMYVNGLAFALAGYRQDDNGKITGPHNGWPEQRGLARETYHFTDKDAATARRIRESDAFKTTDLDRGFILRMTDENYSSIYHTDFDFLERVINRFSHKSTAEPPLGSAFSKYEPIKNNFIKRDSRGDRLPDKSLNASDSQTEEVRKNRPKKLSSSAADLRQTLREILYRSIARIPSLYDLLFRSRR